MQRRLIDDQRRNRRLTVIASFVLLATALGIVWFYNERSRFQGKNVLSDLQEKLEWLSENTDLAQDVSEMERQTGSIMRMLKKVDEISLADIDFTLGTRKQESQMVATGVAKNCKDALVELSSLRQQLTRLTQDGSNIVARLLKATRSGIFTDISGIRAEANKNFLGLKQLCDNLFVIPWKYNPSIDECRRIINLIATNQSGNNDWMGLVKLHNEYVSWTNSATSLLVRHNNTENTLKDNYRKLRSYPFDRENTQGITLKTIASELDSVEPLISKGSELCDTAFSHLDEILSVRKSAVQRDLEAICRLQDLHGDYVGAGCVTSAKNALVSLTDSCSAKRNEINERCRTIRDSISNVRRSQGKASESLSELRAMGGETSDEFVVKKCEENVTLIHELRAARTSLESNMISLTNYIRQAKSEIETTANEVATSLKRLKLSFPDWVTEGRKINSELTDIKLKIETVRGDFEQMQKAFVRYRDVNSSGGMVELRERLNEIRDMLSRVDNACATQTSCSNGRDLMRLSQRRDVAKKDVEGLVEKIQRLSIDLNTALATGNLREKRYVPLSDLSLISSQLQNQAGVGHFDLALDIPVAGKHKVEIRFNKGRRSLYKTSPHTQHKVVASCAVSGVIGKESELSWDDSTISWHGSVILEGEFCSGINDFTLDLKFRAEGYRGEMLKSGVWQFQYDGADNFYVEFLVDGVVNNVLAEARTN